MCFVVSGDKLFNILYISAASTTRFLSWTVTDLSLVLQMMKNDIYRQFLIPSHEVYYVLSVFYKLSILVDNNQIVTNASMVLLSFF